MRSEEQKSEKLSSLRWHPLKCKPGKNKTEYRGELEVLKNINIFSESQIGLLTFFEEVVIDQKSAQVKLGFTVKASTTVGNSTADLAKKNKGSVASITKVLAIMMVVTMPMQMVMNYYHKDDAYADDDELSIDYE